MKKAVLIGWLMLWAATATAATALPDAEKHRLAAYLSYLVVSLEPEGPGGESIYTVGANCGECGGPPGLVGDGVTMLPCGWEDGKYYCNKGKIAKRSDGDAMDYEDIGEAMCEAVCDCGNCDSTCGGGCCDNCKCGTPEREELFEAIENAPLDFNESTVRELEYDLEQALEEVQTLKATCPNCSTCPPQKQTADQPETTVEEPSSDVLTIYKMPGATWNWNGRSNPSTEYMRSHISQEHGIDASGMSREQLQIIHNNAHNYGDDMALGTATYEAKSSGTSSSSCPGGNCPTSGSSRSRGFFFRR